MRFKAGDKVWVRCNNTDFNIFGTKPGVVLGAADVLPEVLAQYPPSAQWYELELPDNPHPLRCSWIGREEHLSPRDDGGRQVGDWHASLWRPNIVHQEVMRRFNERLKEKLKEKVNE